MPQPSRMRKLTLDLGMEVERLLKKLPGADPKLRGDAEPAFGASMPGAERSGAPAPRHSVGATMSPSQGAGALRGGGARGVPISGAAASFAHAPQSAAQRAARARRDELIGAWGRTLSSAALGVAVLWWPYARDCGWLLHAYLGVVAAVLVTGGWASFSAWRVRVAAAHVVALVVMFWGTVLAAEEILPRIGYAASSAIWTCGR